MRDISIIKQRILQYIENKGISKYECYQKTGITNGVLSQNNGMSEDNLLRFLSYYKDINIEWLITGRGDMLKSHAQMSMVAEASAAYEKSDNEYLTKYIQQLEYENGRLITENEKKQEVIDSFMSGTVVINKKAM